MSKKGTGKEDKEYEEKELTKSQKEQISKEVRRILNEELGLIGKNSKEQREENKGKTNYERYVSKKKYSSYCDTYLAYYSYYEHVSNSKKHKISVKLHEQEVALKNFASKE